MGALRLLLAFCVVIWHAGGIYGWRPFNGTACVNYFFVISGFYMTLVLTQKYVGQGSLQLFWSNRFLRLWPSFFFVSVLMAAWRFGDLTAAYAELAPAAATLAAFVNTTMLGYELFDLMAIGSGGVFVPGPADEGVRSARDFVLVGQGWSIGLEIWFYLLAPFVVRSWKTTLVWLLAAAVLFAFAGEWVPDQTWKYRFFPNIMVFFAAGALSWHLWQLKPGNQLRRLVLLIAVRVMLPLTFVLLLVPELMSLVVPEQHHLKLLLLIAVPCIPVWFEGTQGWRLDRLLGELSYPVYLNHVFIGAVVGWLSPQPEGAETGRGMLVLSLSLLLGWMMVRYIETPVDSWRQKRARAALKGEPAL